MNSLGLYVYKLISSMLPETRCFGLKRSLLRMCGAKIESGVRICSSASFMGAGSLYIGKDTWIGHDVLILSSSNVSIGAYVDVAPRVYIGTGTHEIDRDGTHVAGRGINKDVVIEDGAWLCANSTILPGVSVGKKSIVAAGAVVNKSFGDYEIIAGIPAKHLRNV